MEKLVRMLLVVPAPMLLAAIAVLLPSVACAQNAAVDVPLITTFWILSVLLLLPVI